ncbi:3-hydroxyacyl-CoA dehydrogenase family protein [Streptomyces hoynatensis]|uniref:3-hydroxyacyl-CoA dehydrogenase n=1 Tax=Streptomyces hoynatensis TaxID=1141874 RepID=A0A3A9YXV3_9ACTN|nr:3-hydroxyacyl-CoA dehydrogenase [Streptomyces hoynatensis]RKN40067.1 3-hydroxyacyl-CoA dehydrogenase [Streptomyces hoynatensis]
MDQPTASDPQPSAPSVPLPTVAVVGLGTLGTGVAETLARSGRRVIGIDIDEAAARRARGELEEGLARAVADERLTGQGRQEILARFRTDTDLRAAAEADLVIEAVPEEYALKLGLFTALDDIVKPTAILATTTNGLPVTRLAAETAHPERVLGLHFFHPAKAMRLVEVATSVLTAPEARDAVTELAREMGKEPLSVGDRPGLIADGLLFGYLNQAAAMFESRYATREDIDAAMRFGCGLPMGPLALLDLVGIDTAHAVLEAMYERTGERPHAPAPVLGHLVEAGMTGRKAGRGFYTYESEGSGTVVPDVLTPTGPARLAEPRQVEAVGIAGSGTMATGIAEVFAVSGLPVVIAARSKEKAVAGVDRIAASLARSVRKGRLTAADRDAVLARIEPANSLAALSTSDLVIEAVAEELDVKRGLFAELDALCRPGAVLATTTSSLPVIACARATSRPEDVIGMHFFNPAPAMRLVEVVRTILTGDAAHATAHAVCARVRKHPVDCRDRAGFIVNALLFPYLNDAIKMVQEHYASPRAVDTAMKLGGGYPMGPFELLDVIGLDVSLAIQDVLHREFREPTLAPADLLRQLVAAGCLGRKTGRGFHDYAAR